jgi:prolyl-tRNA editing enzyme YbaK/EbsC (Cys-tRNA(Pro) deacylase)
VQRVEAALKAAGVAYELRRTEATARTAADAAAAIGCAVDQIAKSIVFRTEPGGHVVLFLTAGGNRVSAERAAALAGEDLGPADADLVRAETGFAIGGVAPVGHLMPVPTYFDPRLLDFPSVWGAAGTPRHIFPIAPEVLLRITGATVADFTEAPAPAPGA